MSVVRKNYATVHADAQETRSALVSLLGAASGFELCDEERERLRQSAATDAVRTARSARGLDAQTVEHLHRRALAAIRDVRTEERRVALRALLDAPS